jgi:hypothetical protein
MTLLGLLAGLGGGKTALIVELGFWLLTTLLLLVYRAAYIEADRESGTWKRRAKAAGWQASLGDRMWEKIEPQLPPVPLPPYSYPLDLVIGTVANPIVLDRTYTDGALSDTAVASTLSDLVRGCGGRL